MCTPASSESAIINTAHVWLLLTAPPRRRCTGQHGKILEFIHYLIRIGRFTIAQAVLNVVRFILFSNQKSFSGMAAPNMVCSGVFKRRLDRKSLLTDPQANRNRKFPGITINCRKTAEKCSPGLHTNNPSKWVPVPQSLQCVGN